MATSTNPGSEFLAEFSANSQLAVHKIMSTARRNAFDRQGEAHNRYDLALEPGFGEEFDQAVEAEIAQATCAARTSRRSSYRARPRLAGSITLNRTTQQASAGASADPTRANLAWLLAAERLSHDLLALGMPSDLAAQANAIATLSEPVMAAFGRHGLDRRGPVVAEAATRYLIHHAQPAGLRFVPLGKLRRWYADQREVNDQQIDATGSTDAAYSTAPYDGAPSAATDTPSDTPSDVKRSAGKFFQRPRLIWAAATGIADGVLVDRFHHTHLTGLVEHDTWIRRKVIEDLGAAADLVAFAYAGNLAGGAPAMLGVRVHTHRAPNAGMHFLPKIVEGRVLIGPHHRLGGCAACISEPNLPNTVLRGSPTSAPTSAAADAQPRTVVVEEESA